MEPTGRAFGAPEGELSGMREQSVPDFAALHPATYWWRDYNFSVIISRCGSEAHSDRAGVVVRE
jgi:hypothetical protein